MHHNQITIINFFYSANISPGDSLYHLQNFLVLVTQGGS